MLSLDYGGVRMLSRPHEEFGFAIVKGGLTGWRGRPSGRTESQERAGADGEFDAPVWSTGRLVGVSGVILGDGARRRERVLQLEGLGEDGRARKLTVADDLLTQWAWARVMEVSIAEEFVNGRFPRFDVLFRAADPLKYGAERTFVSSGSSVSASHRGNARAFPKFEVRGGTGAYRIVGPGNAEFRVDGSRPSGAVDVIDFKTGLITRNGQPLTRASSRSQVWTVPPYRETSWRVTGSGASATMRLLDTWK